MKGLLGPGEPVQVASMGFDLLDAASDRVITINAACQRQPRAAATDLVFAVIIRSPTGLDPGMAGNALLRCG